MEADLILKGGTLICMDPQRSVRQADLIISGGRIAAIESATRQKARRVLDVRGAVVLPGFVQCRTRLGMSFFRYPEEPASRDRQRRLATLEAGHDRASAFSAAALGVAELLRSGTTAVLDMGDATQAEMLFQAADAMGLRGAFGRTLADKGEGLPKALCASVETSLKEGEALCRRWHNADGGRLRYAVSLRGLMWSSKVLLAKAAQTARGQGLLLTAAVAQDRETLRELSERYGVDPLRYLLDSGFVGPDTVLGQCDVCRVEDLPLLVRSGGSICHCPGNPIVCGEGRVSLPEMLSAGVNVALGCSDPLWNPALDMFTLMRRAIELQESREGGPATLSPRAVLEMATLGGARALGMASEIGSLMPGRKADITVLRLDAPDADAREDLVAHVVRTATAAQVSHTLVGGRVLLDEGRLADVDWEGLLVEAAREAAALRWRAGDGEAGA